MDRIEEYRSIIKRILQEWHTRVKSSSGPVEHILICDERSDHYLLLDLGWSGFERIDGIYIYVRLVENKIHVEVDWTEYGIARELAESGVAKDDIVLAFHRPEKRQHTEFAVA